MDAADSLRPESDDLWNAAVGELEDELKLQIDFKQEDKAKAVDQLLAATEDAQEQMRAKFWSFKRGKGGETVIVRDVLAKVVKWANHFKEIGDLAAQLDPVHAALPWAGLRLLLQAAVGDLDVYHEILERIPEIAETICRNTVLQGLLVDLPPAAEKELRDALVKLYARILAYLAKARLYYTRKALGRIVKYGLLASSDFESAFTAIGEAQAVVDRCSHMSSFETQLEVRADLKRMLMTFDAPLVRWNEALSAITDQLDVTRRNTILQWMSNEPYRQHHEQNKAEVLEGTGEWLLHNQTFQQWKKESASSILWLRGIPGSGKSKLTSIVVDDAMKAFQGSQAPAPVYFYCSRNPAEPGRSDPASILASIARQLSTTKIGGPLLEATVNLYKKHEEEAFASERPNSQEIMDLAMKLLEHFKDATMTIFLDALDECNSATRAQLLEWLEGLLNKSPCLLKVFVSSRDDPDIVSKLNSYPNLYLSSDRNAADIRFFVERETHRLIDNGFLLKSSARKDELRDKVIHELASGAHGMFRWASLQLAMLQELTTDAAIYERLGRLPNTLAKLYAEIFSQIEGYEANSDRRITENVLSWLMCGQEQLPSAVFLSAVISTPDCAYAPISNDQLLRLCCNLVIYDPKLDVFRFSHLSVREFIEGREMGNTASVNALVAEACLAAIADASKGHLPREELLQYSILYWAEHSQAAAELRGVRLRKALLELLCFDHRQFEYWISSLNRLAEMNRMIWYGRSKLEYCFMSESPLITVCVYDLAEVMTEEEWKDKVQGSDVSKMMAVAARWGSHDMLEWQLQREPYFTTTEELVKAAAAGTKEMMAFVLSKRGHEIQITEDIVKAAAANFDNGHEVMALLLDKRGSEIQITEDIVKAAAANLDSGHEVMALLLDKRGSEVQITADIFKAAAANLGSGYGVMDLLLDKRGSEIQITADIVKAMAKNKFSGHEVMALLLDKRGSEIQITADIVKAVAEKDYSGHGVMALLLDKRGPEVHITEDVVKAAASNATSGLKLLTLLLHERGSEIHITEGILKAAMETFASTDILSFLLRTRKVETLAAITSNVCLTAAACGQRDALHYLCQHIPVEDVDPDWDSIARLYDAADNGDVETIRQLPQESTPLDTKDSLGRTPLWIAASQEHLEVVKVLAAQKNVDVDSLALSGRSPIFWPATLGYEDIVTTLLSFGAKSHFVDTEGQTAVTMARKNGHENIVRLLTAQSTRLDGTQSPARGFRWMYLMFPAVVILLGVVLQVYYN